MKVHDRRRGSSRAPRPAGADASLGHKPGKRKRACPAARRLRKAGRRFGILASNDSTTGMAMEIEGRVAVVTGGCSGIGAALARRFVAASARAVVVADLAIENAPAGTIAHRCNVASEGEVAALVARIEADLGRVDIFCSNAG